MNEHTDMPDVSIVIPTISGRGDKLRRALQSVDERDLSIEIIVVSGDEIDINGLSPESPCRRVRRIRHDGPSNAAGNRNVGIEYASGSFVAFLDDDDEFTSGKLSAQIEIMRRSSVDWSFTNYALFDAINNRVSRTSARAMIQRPVDFDLNCAIATPTVVFNTQFLVDNGLRFDETLVSQEDVDLWKRAFRISRPLYITAPMSIVHRRIDAAFNEARQQSAPAGVRRFLARAVSMWRVALDRIDEIRRRSHVLGDEAKR